MDTSFQGNTDNIDGNDEWLTPLKYLEPLGEFDLDPCSPIVRPWPTAKKHYTKLDDGLSKKWKGRVWMNPPYGRVMPAWLKKLKEHGNGIALTYARLETQQFFDHVWNDADAMYFIKNRINFLKVDGITKGKGPGAGSVLIAYGKENAEILKKYPLAGKYIPLKYKK